MSTPHNQACKGDIAKNVLMPGDPLRAKFIAENFLENPRIVNEVRAAYAYTGMYRGKEVSVMASGMGTVSYTHLEKLYGQRDGAPSAGCPYR